MNPTMNVTSMNVDVVDVKMPATMNEYLRLMGDYLVKLDEGGRYVLRHGRDWWMRFFTDAFDGDGPDPVLAFEHLQAVIDDWNVAMSAEGAPTPIPL